jgi:hypothetical protein
MTRLTNDWVLSRCEVSACKMAWDAEQSGRGQHQRQHCSYQASSARVRTHLDYGMKQMDEARGAVVTLQRSLAPRP